MIDTHSHLFDKRFKDDIDECIKRAKENNVSNIVLVGYDDISNHAVYNLSKKYKNYFLEAYGIHPCYVSENYMEEYEKFIKFIKDKKFYAIGECGLDYYHDKTFINEQKEIFKRQIQLSINLSKPLIIHSRDALNDTYEILKEYNNLKGIMHSYSGSVEYAKKFIDLGFYISISGVVTFKNAKNIIDVVKEIDINHLLIETDCPYLTPEPNRGKRNESSFVKYVLYKIAEIKQMDVKVVEDIITKNTYKIFNLGDYSEKN